MMLTKIKIKKVATIAILYFSNALIFLTIWLMHKYDNATIDQFLYQMKSSATGVDHSLGISATIVVGLMSLIACLVEIKVYKKYVFKKSHHSKTLNYFRKHGNALIILNLILAFIVFGSKMDIVAYAKTLVNDTNFFAENYVNPAKVKLKFPNKKRNLIYIYLESMEASYADTSTKVIEANYIQELTNLANNNINFSHNDGFGGMQSFTGTTWTAASMVSQTSGLIIKTPLIGNHYKGEEYLPGAFTLGDILASEGYNQVLLMGSDAKFANRDTYFKNHGNYDIYDIERLKAQGRLDEDYHVWWGYEDLKLFEFAKEELLRLAAMDEAFNFTMLTADTHFPNGYVCPKCQKTYASQYANVIACSSRQVSEFINWIKQQDFYENTTIIITGDHLTMDPDIFTDLDENYVRTVYNCIINAKIKPFQEKSRLYGTFDMFPTTLAALNVEIENDRLGLGTNLFSKEATLAEIYGVEELNQELNNRSKFYEENFFE